MPLALGDLVRRVRHPEHTGARRCVPCTLLNLYVAAAIALAIGLARSELLGMAVFGLLALLVYVRGYLVPGAPALTSVPGRLLEAARRPVDSTDAAAEARPVDSESFVMELFSAGVLERRRNQLKLSHRTHAEWWDRIRRLGDCDALIGPLARTYGVDPDRAQLDRVGGTPVLLIDDRPVELWPSEAALIADLALEPTLVDRVDWCEYDRDERNYFLATFRAFLDTCPDCGGVLQSPGRSVTESGDTVTNSSVTIVCRGCGATILDAQ